MSEQKTELTIIDRVCTALASDTTAQNLIELAKKSQQITVITSKDGRTECHTAAMTAKAARIVIEKTSKLAREDATAFSKAVVAEEKRLIDLIAPEEKRLLTLRDEYDAKIEAEKKAKEEAERARIDGIKASIASIAAWPLNCVSLPATVVNAEISRLNAIEIDDSFAEFFGDAADAKSAALAKLREMYDSKLAAEAEAVRIAEEAAAHAEKMKAEREELDRLRAEATERDRLAEEARATEQRLMQAQRDELTRQQKEIDDQRTKIEADARAAAEEEQKRIDAAASANRELEAKAQAEQAAETLRIATEKAAADKAIEDAATFSATVSCGEFGDVFRDALARKALSEAQVPQPTTKFTPVVVESPALPIKKSRLDDYAIISAVQHEFDISYGEACDWIISVAENLKVAA